MPSAPRKRVQLPPAHLTASEQAKAATPNPQHFEPKVDKAPKHRGPDLRKRAPRRPVVGSKPPMTFSEATQALFDDHKSPVRTTVIAAIIAIGAYGCYRSWREQQRRERK